METKKHTHTHTHTYKTYNNLFHRIFILYLIFFYTLRTPSFKTTSEHARIYLFVSLFLQKTRRRVLVSKRLELEVCLNIPEVSLTFSRVFQNTEAAFEISFSKIKRLNIALLHYWAKVGKRYMNIY